VDFEEVDRRYVEIKRRHEAGDLTQEEFSDQLKQLMVQDEEGRWWAKSPRTGDWHYHDGQTWIRGTPPVGNQNQREPRWEKRRWMVLAASFAALVVAVVAVVALVTFIGNGLSTGQSSNPGDSRQGSQPPNPRVVYKDDFSESSTGWPQAKKELYGYYSEEGHYRIYVAAKLESDYYWAGPTDKVTNQKNAIVEVDATRAGDAPSNPNSNWGIMCRDSESGNYLMGISDAGYPIIQLVDNKDGISVLAKKPSYEGYAIQKDGATNHIRGDCVGSKLTLYVNDGKVLEVDDSTLDGSGLVGLYVQNAGIKPPDTDVFFDNFRLSVP
jgi:hypothetical protein